MDMHALQHTRGHSGRIRSGVIRSTCIRPLSMGSFFICITCDLLYYSLPCHSRVGGNPVISLHTSLYSRIKLFPMTRGSVLHNTYGVQWIFVFFWFSSLDSRLRGNDRKYKVIQMGRGGLRNDYRHHTMKSDFLVILNVVKDLILLSWIEILRFAQNDNKSFSPIS